MQHNAEKRHDKKQGHTDYTLKDRVWHRHTWSFKMPKAMFGDTKHGFWQNKEQIDSCREIM